MKYRKNSFEAAIDNLLPKFDDGKAYSYALVFHGLTREREGGWSTNDSWNAYKDLTREEAIEHLEGRWRVFKMNYLKKAAFKDLNIEYQQDYGLRGTELAIVVGVTSFANVRITY